MKAYRHKVQYYETDRMGIVHHANYIRWMEEARLTFFEAAGADYVSLEKEGVISPVTAVSCRYKATTTYGDTVVIRVRIREFNGIRLKLAYDIDREDGAAAAVGESEHCFLRADGTIINLKRAYPQVYEIMHGLIRDSEETI